LGNFIIHFKGFHLKIKLIALGDKMPAWINEGFKTYAARMPSDYQLELIEVPLFKRSKNTHPSVAMQKECESLLTFIKPTDYIVALDKNGKEFSSEKLASILQKLHDESKTLVLLIGGPDGLTQELLKKTHENWSLSKLTLPHALARIVTAEQLYRAYSIIAHHPYHR